MVQRITEIHGRLGGFGPNTGGTSGRPLVVNGGFIAGDHGSQIVMPSPGRVAFFDDFIGDALDARWYALCRVRAIQRAVNDAAEAAGRPRLDMLNDAECARIVELIAAGTWPDGWDGSEPRADKLLDKVFADGTVQPLLLGLEDS